RQEPAPRREAVVGIWDCEIYLLNPDLERVAWFCAFDVNRPGEDVSAWSLVGDLFVDIAQALLHLFGRYSGTLKTRRTGGEQRVKLNRLARLDMQCRWRGRIVVSPGNCLWCGCQMLDRRSAATIL